MANVATIARVAGKARSRAALRLRFQTYHNGTIVVMVNAPSGMLVEACTFHAWAEALDYAAPMMDAVGAVRVKFQGVRGLQ